MSRFAVIAFLVAAVASIGANADCGLLPTPGVPECTKHFYTQFLDNFGWQKDTFNQRYYVYDKTYKAGGPIFFYTGNEGNVELYTNCTGLMWENAAEFGALLVFAEHRFFGESMPCPGGFTQCGDYLSTEQAMADYAKLISYVKTTQYPDAGATVVFGGSYGGMLAAWMRMRYPHQVQGAIASSAPIGCMDPNFKGDTYWKVVTHDATAAGGSQPACSQVVFDTLTAIKAAIPTSDSSRADLERELKLCGPVKSTDGELMMLFLQAAFDALAMGNYPYPTNYIAGTPERPAPAWPMRKACDYLQPGLPWITNLRNMKSAIDIINNGSGVATCYNISGYNPATYSAIWDFMVCTADLPNELPYFSAAGAPNDMFPAQAPFTHEMLNQHCQSTFGQTPRYGYYNQALGVDAVAASSNIVFANGLLDPWSSGGIMSNVSDSVLAFIIPEGAHHLDLFFSNPQDPPSVTQVRKQEVAQIRKWVAEFDAKKNKHSPRQSVNLK